MISHIPSNAPKENYTNLKINQSNYSPKFFANNAEYSNSEKFNNKQYKFLTFRGNVNKIQIAEHDFSDYAGKTIAEMRKFFQNIPLIPQKEESHTRLISGIISRIKTNHPPLTAEEILEFDKSLFALSDTLKQMTDKEFNDLIITQTFSKEKLIEITLNKIANLPQKKKQKVCKCFNFELVNNPTTQTGFTLEGYPNLINTEEKLQRIQNPDTRKTVQELIPYIDEFLNNNPINSNNANIQKELNELIKILPELRALIGKKAHRTHIFDIFKHSLKVTQKISQDEKFEKLNDSDKRIMLISSLLHDITKKEGIVDRNHAKDGAIDAYFITSKFNLTDSEEFQLHKLIKTHDWLSYPTNMTNEEEITKTLKEIALELSFNNLLEMSTIFTHADLRAVRTDDSIHDIVNVIIPSGKEIREVSHGEATDIFAEQMKRYIIELENNRR